MSEKQICGNCAHRGNGVPGCPFGGNPNAHERCIHPGNFRAKTLPVSYELEAPKQWHIVHEKPKDLPRPKVTKKAAKKSMPQRNSKTGKFVRREK